MSNNLVGNLFLVVAPSGAGKTSLVKGLLALNPELQLSVSYTTRISRADEQDGKDYHFVGEQTFQQMIAEGKFIEYAKVFDNYYGTTAAWLHEQLQAGVDIVLEVDWQGAQNLRNKFADNLTSIFIFPPNLAELQQRLLNRKQNSDAEINLRLATARQDMQHYTECDYFIVNHIFEDSLACLHAIVTAAKLKTSYQAKKMQDFIAGMVS